jgi:hypothetical protein
VIRVGIVDSGIDGPARARVAGAAEFPPAATTRDAQPSGDGPRDLCGHGSRVGAIVAATPRVVLFDARVFFDTLLTSAAQAAAAIDWLLECRVRLINLSFGLREDRAVLREACARAVDGGVLLVAASPARGAAVFPSAYPGVLRATGDARCAPGEISWLDTAQADFGAHPRSADGLLAGASAGCAGVSAALAALLASAPSQDNPALLAALRGQARYTGPERRGPGS